MMDLELLLTLNLWILIIDISFILIAQLFGRRLEAWSVDEQYATVKLPRVGIQWTQKLKPARLHQRYLTAENLELPEGIPVSMH